MFPIRLFRSLSSAGFAGTLFTFGSYFEIGTETEERFYTEEALAASRNPITTHYATSKRLLTRFLDSAPGLPRHFHLVLPNLYGAGENANRLIPYLVNAVRAGGELRLTSGTQVRQFIHVSDVTALVLALMQGNHPPGIYNLCRREPLRIKDLVRLVFSLLGREEAFHSLSFGSNERPDTQMPFLLLENRKAEHLLDFHPAVPLEAGIRSYL